MKQAEWERLLDGFESYDLLTAVDAVDRLRNHLGDDEDGRPPNSERTCSDFTSSP